MANIELQNDLYFELDSTLVFDADVSLLSLVG